MMSAPIDRIRTAYWRYAATGIETDTPARTIPRGALSIMISNGVPRAAPSTATRIALSCCSRPCSAMPVAVTAAVVWKLMLYWVDPLSPATGCAISAYNVA